MRNYTSQVPAIKSIMEIQKFLAEKGACELQIIYNPDTTIKAINFKMIIDQRVLYFCLPVNVEACYKAMIKGVKRVNADVEKRLLKQAERTAWKLMHEWVQIQMALIEMEQATMVQIFLAYAYNPASGQTLYQKLQEGNFKLLP